MIIADPFRFRSEKLYVEIQNLDQLKTVYDWIGRTVAKIDSKLVCIVVQNDELSNKGIVGGFYGLSERWFHQLINLLGVNPIRRTYDKTEEGEKYFYSVKKAREFTGSLYEFAGGQVPKWVTTSIERIFGIRKIFTVALNHEDIRLGTVLLFPRGKLTLDQLEALEQTADAASRRLLEIRNEKLGFSSKERFANALISQINHEIRTPLNGILGLMTEVIDDRENSSEILDDLYGCADQLQRTIDNLVLNSNLSANLVLFRFQTISTKQMCEVLLHMANGFGEKYPEQSIRFKSTILNPREFVSIDLQYMKVAIAELLDNALKFSRIDIQVRLFREDDRLVLEIEDFGCGVSASVVDDLFNPFVRCNIENGKVHHQGNGVGLSMAKKIMDAHEFTLALVQTSAQGSLFAIEMPLIREDCVDLS